MWGILAVLAGTVCGLPACESEITYVEAEMPPELAGLEFGADVTTVGFAPTSIRGELTVTNATSDPIALDWGACAVALHAYSDRSRTGVPDWRSEHRADPRGFTYGCVLIGYEAVLAPGDSLPTFVLEVPVYEMLADSLPDGRYYFAARLSTNGVRSAKIPAGDAFISGTVQPVPQSRDVDGVRFTGLLEPAGAAGEYRYTLSAENRTSDPVPVRGDRSVRCPVRLSAYRSPGRRDTWYMRSDADWAYRDGCLAHVPETTLDPGESASFSGTFSAPGFSPRGIFHALGFNWIEVGDRSHRIVLAPGTLP